MTYSPPDITSLEPSDLQKRIIDACVGSIELMGMVLWTTGRGAGKSTTRAMIAQAILDADPDIALYEVRPKEFQ